MWKKITSVFSGATSRFPRRFRSHRSYSSVQQSVPQRRPQSPVEKRLRIIKILRFLAVLVVLFVIASLIAFFTIFAWVSRDLPQPGKVVRTQGFSTKFFDRNGKLLYDLYADERRDPVTIDQIPKNLQNATVSIEDKEFYTHQGFDPLTPLRIVYNYVFRRRRVIGGSTLTQQLVKNVLLTNERSVMRKFKELVLAIQIERTFKKDQILEMYLNEAPYGGNAAGVGAASQMYFGKPTSQLNLVESAVLAGLPQRPTAYSPYSGQALKDGTPLWKNRAKGVLTSMYDNKYINKSEYDQSMKDLDTLQFKRMDTSLQAPHFIFYVRNLLEKQFGQDVVAKGGLQVTTSLDLDLQNKAQNIVTTEIDKVKKVNISNGAAMVLNPQTGEILSMVGSAGYNRDDINGKFNVAVDGLRQPGSSIKPVTYLAMLRKGFTPATMLVDAPTTFQQNAQIKAYTPNNYDGKFHGPMNLKNGLGNSINTIAIKSLAIVGIDNFLTLAHDMGFPTLEPTKENLSRFGLSLTLGGGEVHLIDTVTSYSAFANGGKRVDSVAILNVTDRDGNVLYAYHHVEGRSVMTAEEAFLIDTMLSDNSARTLAFGPSSLLNTGKPIAVKTGTTNDKKDNWAIGWSQQIMVGTWVGNNDDTAMTQVASGVSGASPIWRKIIDEALKSGYKAPDWVPPAGVDQVNVDDISGYPSHDGFPSHQEYVIKGTLPALPDPIHTKLKVCRGQNQLATDALVAGGNYDEKEYVVLREDDPYSQDNINRWQAGIATWISQQTDAKYKPPTDYCGSSSDIFVRLNEPHDQTKYNVEDITIDVNADSGDGIEKMEIWVDNNLNQTVNGKSFHGVIHMPGGRHQVYAKAFSRSGKLAQTGTANIGTGNQDWQQPSTPPSSNPNPTPAPSPTPTPSAPSPSPSPLPSILSSPH